MDTETVKQIVEAIKTININVNSDTGKQALIVVADKLQYYLIFKEVLQFMVYGLFFSLIAIVAIIAIKAMAKNEKQSRILRAITDEDFDKKYLNELLK